MARGRSRKRDDRPRAVCPLCKQERSAVTTPFSEEYLQRMGKRKLSPYYFAVGDSPRIAWACDHCIASGSALRANPEKQQFGLGGPVLAYADTDLHCLTCKKEFTFRAVEQKYWYEMLSFWIDSWPRNCPDCRRAERRKKDANRELAEQLEALDPGDHEQLERIAQLYQDLGSEPKAQEFARRAANVRKRKDSAS